MLLGMELLVTGGAAQRVRLAPPRPMPRKSIASAPISLAESAILRKEHSKAAMQQTGKAGHVHTKPKAQNVPKAHQRVPKAHKSVPKAQSAEDKELEALVRLQEARQTASSAQRSWQPTPPDPCIRLYEFLRRRAASIADSCLGGDHAMQHAVRHMLNRECSRGWRAWTDFILERAIRLAMLRKTLGHLGNRHLSLGWGGWMDLVREREEFRRLLRKGLSFMLNQRLATGMSTWRSAYPPQSENGLRAANRWTPPPGGWVTAPLRHPPYALRGLNPLVGLSQREPWGLDVADPKAQQLAGCRAADGRRAAELPMATQAPAWAKYATASLKSLDDGQNDDIATLHRRRLEEDLASSAAFSKSDSRSYAASVQRSSTGALMASPVRSYAASVRGRPTGALMASPARAYAASVRGRPTGTLMPSPARLPSPITQHLMGKPAWDSSSRMYVPPALRGLKPVTHEPWARDQKVYLKGADHEDMPPW